MRSIKFYEKIKGFLFVFIVLLIVSLIAFFIGYDRGRQKYEAVADDYRKQVELSDIEIDRLGREIELLGRAGSEVLGRVESVGERLADVFEEVQRFTDSRARADTLGRAMVYEVRELISILYDNEGYFRRGEGDSH